MHLVYEEVNGNACADDRLYRDFQKDIISQELNLFLWISMYKRIFMESISMLPSQKRSPTVPKKSILLSK